MTLEARIQQALAYFTEVEHSASFALLSGQGPVLLSAPHATLQTRNGVLKCAERYTGMCCLLAHQDTDCPVLFKTRHLGDDANHDPVSPYRTALCQYVRAEGIRLVLDLHQLAPERPMDLCLCTGHGHHLLGQDHLAEGLRQAFLAQGIRHITQDVPFSAARPHTVASTVVRECGIPAIQLEINSRLLMEGDPAYCFPRVLQALTTWVLGFRQ